MNLLALNHKWVGASGAVAFLAALAGDPQLRSAVTDAVQHPSATSILGAAGLLLGAAALYYGKPHTV